MPAVPKCVVGIVLELPLLARLHRLLLPRRLPTAPLTASLAAVAAAENAPGVRPGGLMLREVMEDFGAGLWVEFCEARVALCEGQSREILGLLLGWQALELGPLHPGVVPVAFREPPLVAAAALILGGPRT